MIKKYVVRLSAEERGICEDILKKLKGSTQKFRRAQILLQADVDGPGWTDAQIAVAYHCRVQTVENLRKRLVTEGFELALEGHKRKEPPTPCKLDGQAEAKLIAHASGSTPGELRALDVTTSRRPVGDPGSGRFHQSRDRP
jgi:hypothetical protein